MFDHIKKLLVTYREQLLYLLFGTLTTAVDFGVSFVLYYFWGDAIDANVYLIHAANLSAWGCAVLFAYVTNRKWVFRSDRRGFLPILCELGGFAGGRLFTLLLQEAIFFVFFDLCAFNEYAVKIVAAVLVVILNYLISKLLIFRKHKTDKV
ncbi:MAG: GtrA family protein [Clostridia bacterium]|nr:GtrA family protein [Clostridia bacterium]